MGIVGYFVGVVVGIGIALGVVAVAVTVVPVKVEIVVVFEIPAPGRLIFPKRLRLEAYYKLFFLLKQE